MVGRHEWPVSAQRWTEVESALWSGERAAPVLGTRPADPVSGLVSNIPAVASRSSGSLTAARAAQRRSTPAQACPMPLLYPKPNPLQKANLCSRLFFW